MAIRISSFTIFRLVLKCGVDLIFIFSILALFYMVKHADGAPHPAVLKKTSLSCFFGGGHRGWILVCTSC